MKEMDDALAELRAAQTLHGCAQQALEAAQREEFAALKRLNDAQKRFDQVASLVRDNPAWGTEWHRKKHPGVPA